MTTNTEDLRREFETSFDGDIYDLTRCTICPDEYADSATNDAWLGYQVGHAAGIAAERERCANLAADLAADACVAYANGEPIAFRTAVGDAIRAGGDGARPQGRLGLIVRAQARRRR